MIKHHYWAAVASALLPGAGQWLNRQWLKGLFFMACGAGAVLFFADRLLPALAGIVTLGETPSVLQQTESGIVLVPGDHSIHMLIEGLIVLCLFVLALLIWGAGIRDAFGTGRRFVETGSSPAFNASLAYLVDRKFPQLLLVLPMLGLLFLTIMPIVFMIMIAFTNYSSPHHIPPAHLVDWVGWQTFADLFQLKSWSKTLLGVLQWTVVWAVVATVTTFMSGLLVALLIGQRDIRWKGIWRLIIIIPYAIPQMISLLAMKMIFNGQFGPVNQYLSLLGFGRVPWLTDPLFAKATVILVNMWVGMPLAFLLVSGVLSSIPRELYEAAIVEGAGAMAQFRVITLPVLLVTLAPLLIIQFAGNFNNFNVIYLLTDGLPVNSSYQYAGHTDLLITWLYKLTLNNNVYNMASAIGILIFLFVAGLSLWNYSRTRSFREEDMMQ